jgi:hypothetical protein
MNPERVLQERETMISFGQDIGLQRFEEAL